jgi:hypothetical protein
MIYEFSGWVSEKILKYKISWKSVQWKTLCYIGQTDRQTWCYIAADRQTWCYIAADRQTDMVLYCGRHTDMVLYCGRHTDMVLYFGRQTHRHEEDFRSFANALSKPTHIHSPCTQVLLSHCIIKQSVEVLAISEVTRFVPGTCSYITHFYVLKFSNYIHI